MPINKTIAIVGATEKRGIEIANRFSCMPYRLVLISNDSKGLSELFQSICNKNPESEIEAIDCVKDGCWEADIIILAIPVCEEKMVTEKMREVATQKIVTTISTPLPEVVLPYSRLVKISDVLSGNPVFIEGIDEPANEEISSIFNLAGYKTIIKHRNKNHNN